MQKIKLFLSVIGFLLVMWVGLFIFHGIQSFEHEGLEDHLPQETHLAIKINNKKLLTNIFSDLLFKKSLSRKDLSKLEQRESSDIKDLINAFAPKNEIIIFQENWKNQAITALLFKPNKASNFKSKIDELGLTGSIYLNVACLIISDISELNEQEVLEHFEYALTSDYIKSPARNKFIQSKNNEDQIQLYIAGNNESNIQEIISSLNLNKNSIELKGTGIINPIKYTESEKFHYISYDSNSLNMVMGKLPDTLNYYFKGCLELLGLPKEGIVSTQIQYKGASLKSSHTQLKLLPKFNGVFRYKDTLHLSDFDGELHTDIADGAYEFKPVEILGDFFYVLKLGPKEIYVGLNENPEIVTQKSPMEFEIKGDISQLLNLDTDPFMLTIINSFPLYVNSTAFLDKIENFNIKSKVGPNNNYILNGSIDFNSSEEASVELIKYLLTFVK